MADNGSSSEIMRHSTSAFPQWSKICSNLADTSRSIGVGGETSIEEFVLCPANELTDDQEPTAEGDKIRLYGPQEDVSWVARPVTGQSTIGLASRAGSIINQNVPLMDPLVTLFGSVH
ncbi:hypothetical protein Vadar_005193 [Vaccinium darrowii]|uniref:Uncharacterized protein n=1 Tax=Vaccinium darrowii TaxID=229202 RepID=A0ACB7YBK7_9ERIC|nr:hypothetical protein Vadar_005193 [Vaccinium darrowii]